MNVVLHYLDSLGSPNAKVQADVKRILRRSPASMRLGLAKWVHENVPLQELGFVDCGWYTLFFMMEVMYFSGYCAIKNRFSVFDGIEQFHLSMLYNVVNTLVCNYCSTGAGE